MKYVVSYQGWGQTFFIFSHHSEKVAIRHEAANFLEACNILHKIMVRGDLVFLCTSRRWHKPQGIRWIRTMMIKENKFK